MHHPETLVPRTQSAGKAVVLLTQNRSRSHYMQGGGSECRGPLPGTCWMGPEKTSGNRRGTNFADEVLRNDTVRLGHLKSSPQLKDPILWMPGES